MCTTPNHIYLTILCYYNFIILYILCAFCLYVLFAKDFTFLKHFTSAKVYTSSRSIFTFIANDFHTLLCQDLSYNYQGVKKCLSIMNMASFDTLIL